MSRRNKARIRAAHEHLDMSRGFKNDALQEHLDSNSFYSGTDRFQSENEMFKGVKKNLRRLKKYNGPSGLMTETNYMELMGA